MERFFQSANSLLAAVFPISTNMHEQGCSTSKTRESWSLAQTACSPSKSHGFAASCARGPLVTTENKQITQACSCTCVVTCRLQMMQMCYPSLNNTRHLVCQISSQVLCASPATCRVLFLQTSLQYARHNSANAAIGVQFG